ncbi:16450_t:CDS:1, partial [Funneliformis geosporum]
STQYWRPCARQQKTDPFYKLHHLTCLPSSCLATTRESFIRVLITPIDLIKYGLQHVTPRTIAHELVKNKDGPAEASFQAALYAAFNGLLPTGMIKHNEKWAGYELKISRADFSGPVTQAGKYAEHFKINIHLVNFYPDTSSTPVFPDTTANIIVVNVKCNKDCSQFKIDSSNSNGPKNEFINNLLSNSK